ncbi:SHOCT domain-containing protein [Conexibacter sp. JD483]|uniref:SHOCT domain-containing protein n=1 Tax=unclassified Conexibacter TaxID=2627773 RepID=UPI00271D3450|nr:MULTISPECIES: SHOCT domain-containing protein [unclassified Conexibacter]MDO8185620.1 SHOCT domain-containing protein [Conexibacter sp. CPCC 205706]MDO8198793.1 SHOCT domain-containing protein [Conexibacter sp. CPCC 205762]MDR9367857.1 SHOCT domain-containing protein [Conexibacter sp. JD483]
MRRRRPLLCAAAVGGGAYLAGKSRGSTQQRETANDDTITQLQQLGQLRDQGVLTDEEFAAQKARLLGP